MNRIITEQQVQEVINILAEMQAKYSFGAITMLQQLPEQPTTEQPTTDNT